VRIGTCGALTPGFALGELVTATAVLSADGASRALGAPADAPRAFDAGLSEALLAAGGGRAVTAVSTDLFYDAREDPGWVDAGASVVEMESATLLAIAERRECRAACLLAVTDTLDGGRERLEHDAVTDAGLELGRVAVAALLR